MISLSTAWNHTRHTTGTGLINEIRAAGFDTVELNFALTHDIVNEIETLVRQGAISVSSLHNMCPLPELITPAAASPDYYSLASADEAERARAVTAAKQTIDCAHRLGAKAVILHMGRVPIQDGTRDLAAVVTDPQRSAAIEGKTAAAIRERLILDRDTNRQDHLEYAMQSLGELAPYAGKQGIALGIENRYYYREIPIREELDIILRNFRRSNVYYWHDVGHAEAFERLGLGRHKDLLENFSNRLLGMHLHDIIGVMGDHKAPGSGTFDFRLLEPYITRDTIKVIEAHQPASAGQLRKSVEYLADIFTDRF